MLRECLTQLLVAAGLLGGPCDPADPPPAPSGLPYPAVAGAPYPAPAAVPPTLDGRPASLAPRTLSGCLPRPGEGVPRSAPHPTLLTDLAVVGGVTGLFVAFNPDVRRGVFTQASLGHIVANFRHPIRRSLEGARDDRDAFTTNYVSHPLSWATLGFYLRQRGYSRGAALLFSQAHSVAWEFVIEGSYQTPSGKDLVTNLASSAVAIYVLHPIVGRRGGEGGDGTPRVSLLLEPLSYPDLVPGPAGGGPPSGPGLTLGFAVSR